MQFIRSTDLIIFVFPPPTNSRSNKKNKKISKPLKKKESGFILPV